MYSSFRTHIEKFVKLTDADWDLLLPYLEIRKLKKNELFAEQGKIAGELCFVMEGMLRQYYMKNGEEKTTYFFFDNHLAGAYFSCLTQKPSLLTIEALSECKVVVFPYKVLKELFETNMAWQTFGRLLAEYLALGLEERMVELLILTPEERYIELITGNKVKIIERIPQHYIANYLGLTPVSLSRIRNRVTKK